MRFVLIATVVSCTALFAYLVVCRRRHLELAELAADLDASDMANKHNISTQRSSVVRTYKWEH